jgi:hypothetical protein
MLAARAGSSVLSGSPRLADLWKIIRMFMFLRSLVGNSCRHDTNYLYFSMNHLWRVHIQRVSPLDTQLQVIVSQLLARTSKRPS